MKIQLFQFPTTGRRPERATSGPGGGRGVLPVTTLVIFDPTATAFAVIRQRAERGLLPLRSQTGSEVQVLSTLRCHKTYPRACSSVALSCGRLHFPKITTGRISQLTCSSYNGVWTSSH